MDVFPELVVMLTHRDQTVPEAYELFQHSKTAKANYWGIKESGLPLAEMRRLCDDIRQVQKTPVLEVVQYTEPSCLEGARMAAACGCEILMGTMYFPSVHDFCNEHGIRYMPFVGRVHSRPSVLEGTAEEMIAQAEDLLARGVYGIDLLGYRFSGKAPRLNATVIPAVSGPVCLAGSIDSFRRLQEVKEAGPAMFTIGGAFFEHRFGNTLTEQINTVSDFITGSNNAPEQKEDR